MTDLRSDLTRLVVYQEQMVYLLSERSHVSMQKRHDMQARIHAIQIKHGDLTDEIVQAVVELVEQRDALLTAMPTLPHPGGELIKVVAHYEDGSTQTIDGKVISAAIAKARGKSDGR